MSDDSPAAGDDANATGAPEKRSGKMRKAKTNAPPSTWEAWKKHIAEGTALEQAADRDKVAAILEKGQRIAAFHAAEKAAKWFKSWDEACRKTIGIERTTAAMYETAAVNLVGITNDILPSNLDALYQLGLARRTSKEAFDEAIKAGDIHAEMSRANAKDICEKFGGSLRRSRRGSRNRTPPIVARLLEAADGVVKELREWCKKEIKLGFRHTRRAGA
jgi:hypothetical protein